MAVRNNDEGSSAEKLCYRAYDVAEICNQCNNDTVIWAAVAVMRCHKESCWYVNIHVAIIEHNLVGLAVLYNVNNTIVPIQLHLY